MDRKPQRGGMFVFVISFAVGTGTLGITHAAPPELHQKSSLFFDVYVRNQMWRKLWRSYRAQNPSIAFTWALLVGLAAAQAIT
ncbi:MAG: hypothetical protein H0X66_18000 [Verrucomicrobia bacterium]|nr:hypothetical protein [Verrucomicrobiota bacterium]